jgi:hypothetical protein
LTTFEDDEDELQGRMGVVLEGKCAVGGCSNNEIDERGAIRIDDHEEHAWDYWMCTQHWEAIIIVLGQQDDREDDAEADVWIRGWELTQDITFREADDEPEWEWNETQPEAQLTRAEAEHLLSELAYEGELNGI